VAEYRFSSNCLPSLRTVTIFNFKLYVCIPYVCMILVQCSMPAEAISHVKKLAQTIPTQTSCVIYSWASLEYIIKILPMGTESDLSENNESCYSPLSQFCYCYKVAFIKTDSSLMPTTASAFRTTYINLLHKRIKTSTTYRDTQ